VRDETPAHDRETARRQVQAIFAAAVAAVEPAAAVRSWLTGDDGAIAVGEVVVPVPRGVHVVAVGKAATAMTHGALEALGELVVSGDVITKDGHVGDPLPPRLRVSEAGHPIPDERGVVATSEALAALRRLEPGVVVLALISGGGSALLEAPRQGLTLADLAATTQLLLRAGAPIDDLNAVRAPLSQVKAGGLRAAAPNATWITLILSDVLGNDPRVIASGPTVPGRDDPAVALETLDRYGLRARVPAAVLTSLQRSRRPGAVPRASGDVLRVVGDNGVALEAAAHAAQELGLRPRIVWQAVEGEAADLGREWVEMLAASLDDANVLLGGGEATVTVRGDGRGGRNTEFALAAALELERRGMGKWVAASLATDGQDALTGAAGAIADSGTCGRARAARVDPAAALARNDSLAVFQAAGGLVVTGPTGTNVNDLYLAVHARGAPTAPAGGE
jgi:hydroxypyruvate reductase